MCTRYTAEGKQMPEVCSMFRDLPLSEREGIPHRARADSLMVMLILTQSRFTNSQTLVNFTSVKNPASRGGPGACDVDLTCHRPNRQINGSMRPDLWLL